jgi:hypothetical protein
MLQQTPLTNEQVQRYAPSAFAGQAYERQSSRYAFVPTSLVIDGMRSAGFFPVKASQSRTRIAGKENFTKHMIRFRDQNATVTKLGDSVMELVLINSHDGTSAYDLSCGMFRLACLNGLMVATSLVEALHIRHTGNIISEVVEGSTKLLQNAPVISDTVQQWRTIDLSPVEQKILAEEAHSLRFDGEGNSPNPEKLLAPRRWEDNGTDLWSTFNRVQENAIKGGLRTIDPETRRRNRTREVRGIDQNVRLNRALWSLAEKMAALKTA